MLNYLQQRNKEIVELHKMYSPEIPEFIQILLESPEIFRLNGIGQHCGIEYVKIPMFYYKYFYSRLDHSLGVALILWNFTKNEKQTISGLLHDISSTVFAHVGDFLKKDYLHQEATETCTTRIISNSRNIMDFINEKSISINEINDYKIYPIADNKNPALCSDRLECSLHYPLIRGILRLEDLREIYKNIKILINENGVEELGFTDIKCAEKLAQISISNGILDSSNEDKLCMHFLAYILELMINKNVICEDDLYIMTEKQLIDKIESCNLKSVLDAWKYYKNMTEVKTSDKPIFDKYCISLDVKKRYVNPLVETETGVYRISEISKEINQQINDFKGLTLPKYVYIDFKG